MQLSEIEKIISAGESASLELKTSTAKLKSIFETLCAFLNTKGGTVLIGVKDDGRIVGQEITDQTNLEISNMITKIEPPIDISIEKISLNNNKSLLKLSVYPNAYFLPYVFNGRPFWRVGSSTRSMPQQQYQQLLFENINITKPWDKDLATHVDIQQLNAKEIIKTLNESIRRGRVKARPRLISKEFKNCSCSL